MNFVNHELIDLVNGKLHLDQMISKHIKLADVNTALHALKSGEEARHVIMFDQ